MDLTIRVAGLDEVESTAVMINALDRHYLGDANAPDLKATRAMAERTIRFGEGTRFLLAFDSDMPIGIACFAILRPGHRLGGLIYLKDLFVVESQRGAGVGAALMQWLAGFAIENGVSRMDLTTEPRNPAAVRFYEKLGGEKPDKIYFRFSQDALEKMARLA